MQRRILILILLVNTILAILYLILGLVRRKNKDQERGHRGKYILLSIVILICPVVGICFLCFSHLLYKVFSKREVDMSDVSFSREKVQIYIPADVKRDINIVPMADVLNISDIKYRRQMVLDVLKKDARRAMNSIALAMDNDDSETSHYAASVLMDALSEFRGNMQNMLKNFNETPEDSELGIMILEYLSEILHQNVLTGGEKTSYIYMADQVGETIFKETRYALNGQIYSELTEFLMEVGDYQTAKKWGDRALEYQPDSVESYICNLKLYFKYENREEFFLCMDKLKASNLTVGKEAMEYIRLFQREEIG